jgi:hypothetical protein
MFKNNSVLAVFILIFSTHAFSNTDSLDSEMRKPRQWALSAEVGINSLSSLLGPVVTYYAHPLIAVDMGLGLSSSGLRPGVRGRYLFTHEKTSFSGGIGFKYGLGSDGVETKFKDPDTKVDLKITTEKTAFLDFMLGADFMADNGFLVIANLGWSQLLTSKPYVIVSGTPSDQGEKVLNTVFGSGLLLSVSLGKAF